MRAWRMAAMLAGLVIVASLSGCVGLYIEQRERALLDSKARLTITVESVPSGAMVYGCVNGSRGTFLGETPLVLLYAPPTSRFGEIYGQFPNEVFQYEVRFRCIVVKEGYREHRIDEVLTKGEWYGPLRGESRSYEAILEAAQASTRME